MKIITLNINRKKTQIKEYLKQYNNYKIICFQETTYLTHTELENIEKVSNMHTFFSAPEKPNHCGVLTLISKTDN